MKSSILSWFNILICLVLGSSLWSSCSDQNFNSSPRKKSAALDAKGIEEESDEEGIEEEPDTVLQTRGMNHSGSIIFKNTFLAKDGGEITVKKPLAVLFLIDKTYSMDPYIQAVKDNVQSFVDTLKGKDFDVKVGYIAYEDKIMSEYKFTSDINAFKNAVGTITPWLGFDEPEGGLAAIIRATERFQDSSLKSYLKVMVLISDNLSHSDSNRTNDRKVNNRNCTIIPAREKINKLSKDLQEQIKIYYSVQTYVNNTFTCREYNNNPKQQLDDLLSTSFNKLNSSTDKGGYLGWPFNATTLNTTLPNMIYKVNKPNILCLIDKIKIDIDSTNSITYESSFKEEYELFKAGKESTLDVDVNAKIYKFLKNKKNSGLVTTAKQTCFYLPDIEKNDFSHIVSQSTVNINYKFQEN